MSREQFDQLFQFLVEFAQDQLSKRAEFHPFAAAISSSGKMELVAVYDEGQESQVMIDTLVDGFRLGRNKYLATGICFDSRVVDPSTDEKTDAIAVDLEGPSDQAVTVYVPYADSQGIFAYGDTFGVLAEPRIYIGD